MNINIKPNIPNIVSKYPQSAVVISKLNHNKSGNQRPYTAYNYLDVSKSSTSKIRNNEAVLTLLPDLEIAIQIMTACIIDPNGFVDTSLIYNAPYINMTPSIKANIVTAIQNHIDQNYDLKEKLNDIIRESLFTKGSYVEAIIPEASLDRLINRSSVYNGNTPMYNTESIDLINKELSLSTMKVLGNSSSIEMNTESIISNYGNLKYTGDTKNIQEAKRKTLESFNKSLDNIKSSYIRNTPNSKSKTIVFTEESLNIEITDNYNILHTPNFILNKIRNSKKISLSSKYKHNQEANYSELEVNHYLDSIFRNNASLNKTDVEFALRANETIRESIGLPLVMKLPTESVIPVYAKNDPSKHVGYFVLLDNNGYPIDIEDTLAELDSKLACGTVNNNTMDLKTNIIQRAQHGLYGALQQVAEVADMENLYNDIVDHMIKSKLRNSDFSDLVDIKESADIYKVMLTRSLAAKQTKLLYLPYELVQYYAFYYRKNGTGESLLERVLILASMAGMLLYANVRSSIVNAIPVTDITLTLDQTDPNPLVTGEKYVGELLRSNSAAFPLGTVNPSHLQDALIRSSYRVKLVSPYLPELEVDRSVSASQKGDIVDSGNDIYKQVVGMIIKSLGMSPEIIENGMKEDFAATVLAKNKLLAKRVIRLQNILIPQLTEHVRKIMSNDPVLMDKIKEIVISNKDELKKYIKKSKPAEGDSIELDNVKDSDLADYITEVFVNGIEITLPKPEFNDEDNKAQAFDSYMQRLENVVDKLYTADMFTPEVIGKINGGIDKIKNMVKSGLMHKWMTDNNFMPDLTSWYTKENDETINIPLFENNLVFTTEVAEQYIEFCKKYIKEVESLSKKYEKVEEDINAISDGGGFSGGDDDYNSDGGEEGSEGGDEFGDDMGMGEDEGGMESEEGEEGMEETSEENMEETPEENNPEESENPEQ